MDSQNVASLRFVQSYGKTSLNDVPTSRGSVNGVKAINSGRRAFSISSYLPEQSVFLVRPSYPPIKLSKAVGPSIVKEEQVKKLGKVVLLRDATKILTPSNSLQEKRSEKIPVHHLTSELKKGLNVKAREFKPSERNIDNCLPHKSTGTSEARLTLNSDALINAIKEKKRTYAISLIRNKETDLLYEVEGRTAMSYAIEDGDFSIFNFLSRSRYPINHKAGRTALGDACFFNQAEMAKDLVNKGASVKLVVDMMFKEKEFFSRSTNESKKLKIPNFDMIRFLKDAGADVKEILKIVSEKFANLEESGLIQLENSAEFQSTQNYLYNILESQRSKSGTSLEFVE